MAAPSRHFLTFDGRGSGRTAEVLGDLAHADRVAVLVPGSDTSLDTYARFRATATHLWTALNRRGGKGTAAGTGTATGTGTGGAGAGGAGTGARVDTHAAPGPRTAVVAWLGYETPATISTTVATSGRAEQAAPQLREFIRQLRGIVGEKARLSLLCHSYGSVVCGRAAAGLDVDDIALLGSPGTGADTAAALHTRAQVWAARGSDDWVGEVPHVEADLFGTTVGFGTDPISPSFGARVFAAGDGGHSDYFAPGSVSLTNLARIVLGETSEVTRA
ncbi:Alpha/beta hydrolase OS=Streptomyces alboniger OX=132473 GN=CP975_10680 PE=4 SV=1 [Streptomyces alboniger]